ncbi:isocitrate lyase/PEP mutase family protein [Cupriavidus plantarum]|uniref:isocitrate lyase/PEP mutase family protein n=1 Tax=Cupriavidus plantarum TaxID=942865 RepID=UPI001B05594B|nr:isocitrate lyase/PEP mutase family protein [Cupriavidus plantarum]CAG2128026.1 2,3-dimethylmalate lyase [Cupriavidus plantarum]SMR66796.1 methylisocitrate lyase [Cupriavidus plantarum]
MMLQDLPTVIARRVQMRLRLESGRTLWVPGAYDALSARMIVHAGFEAVVVSGFGVSAAMLGLPDTELYTMTENLSVVRAVCHAVPVPVMADCDTGYGNAINVMRTVREFEAAGAASLTLEDQVSPKKCPAVSDATSLLPIEEAVGKIRAAVAARRDPSMAIIARTDARTPEEAFARGKAYAAAGADVIKPISKCFDTFEGLVTLREAVQRPLAISLLGKLQRNLTTQQIEALGGICTFPLLPLLTAAAALQSNLAALRQTLQPEAVPIAPIREMDFRQWIGFDDVEALERQFLPDTR